MTVTVSAHLGQEWSFVAKIVAAVSAVMDILPLLSALSQPIIYTHHARQSSCPWAIVYALHDQLPLPAG